MYLREQWLACWSSVSYIIGLPYLAQARPALTWLGQRLNNKTDSKKNFSHLFRFKPFENKFLKFFVTFGFTDKH